MRASYALPGIFDPVKLGRRCDGWTPVNPIPITAAARARRRRGDLLQPQRDIRLRTVIQSQ
jgi:predicted acylesterase/phospholipase RssA